MDQLIEKRNQELSRRIMRRVYLIAAIRTLLSPVLLKSLIVFVFFWRSMSYVSYAHVIANAPSLFDIKDDITFYSSALMHAEMVTLALLSSIFILVAWISYDMISKRSHAWL